MSDFYEAVPLDYKCNCKTCISPCGKKGEFLLLARQHTAIGCPVSNLVVGPGTMLATGGSAVVAQKIGSGNTQEARRNFTLFIGRISVLFPAAYTSITRFK